MTRYIPKPTPVEAMQWLGPVDLEHVKSFEEWLRRNCEIIYAMAHTDGTMDVDDCRFFLDPGDWVVAHGEHSYSVAKDDFHARYTPAQDGE